MPGKTGESAIAIVKAFAVISAPGIDLPSLSFRASPARCRQDARMAGDASGSAAVRPRVVVFRRHRLHGHPQRNLHKISLLPAGMREGQPRGVALDAIAVDDIDIQCPGVPMGMAGGTAALHLDRLGKIQQLFRLSIPLADDDDIEEIGCALLASDRGIAIWRRY